MRTLEQKTIEPEMNQNYLLRVLFNREVLSYFSAARICHSMLEKGNADKTLLEDIHIAKNNFYIALDIFLKENAETLTADNNDILASLKEYEEQDWSKNEVFSKVQDIVDGLFQERLHE